MWGWVYPRHVNKSFKKKSVMHMINHCGSMLTAQNLVSNVCRLIWRKLILPCMVMYKGIASMKTFSNVLLNFTVELSASLHFDLNWSRTFDFMQSTMNIIHLSC